MGRKSRQKKKKRENQKRRASGDFIIRGDSERGDFLLELAKYAQAYQEDFKEYPFEGLTETQKETIMETLLLLRHTKKLPSLFDDPQGFLEMAKRFTDAERNRPSNDPGARPTIENVKDEMFDGTHTVGEVKKSIMEGYHLYPDDPSVIADDGGLNVAIGTPDGAKHAVRFSKEERERVEAGARSLGVSVAEFIKSGIGQEILRSTIKDTKRNRRFVLDQYLMLHNILTHPDRAEKGLGTLEKETGNLLWAKLRDARIFEIPVSLFTTLYHESDLFLCKQAGVEWTWPGERDIPPDEIKLYTETFRALLEGWQIPEHMPFECIYFGIDHAVYLSPDQRSAMGVPKDTKRCSWMGFLVASEWVFTLIRTESQSGKDTGVYVNAEMKDGRWNPTVVTSTPFIVTWLIDWVNDHQTCVQEGTSSFSYRHDYKKISKRWQVKRPIPAPYYTVYIKDELIDQEAWLKKLRARQSVRPRKSPQHQYDVRGSWVCRFMRGPLPLDPKLEKRLRRDKRRRIFTHQRLDADTAQHMLKRGIAPKRVDEWLSVLLYWRQDHKKGPMDGPYVPSIRKSARKLARAVGE